MVQCKEVKHNVGNNLEVNNRFERLCYEYSVLDSFANTLVLILTIEEINKLVCVLFCSSSSTRMHQLSGVAKDLDLFEAR